MNNLHMEKKKKIERQVYAVSVGYLGVSKQISHKQRTSLTITASGSLHIPYMPHYSSEEGQEVLHTLLSSPKACALVYLVISQVQQL